MLRNFLASCTIAYVQMQTLLTPNKRRRQHQAADKFSGMCEASLQEARGRDAVLQWHPLNESRVR